MQMRIETFYDNSSKIPNPRNTTLYSGVSLVSRFLCRKKVACVLLESFKSVNKL